jgi:thiol-disulfide isomerase/thioredoxin
MCSRRGPARFEGRGGVVRLFGEGQAVRTLFGVGLLLACLGLSGCSLFGKKKDTADATPRNGSGGAVARNDVPPSDPLGPAPGANGLLAGEVRDSFNRLVPNAYIQIVDLQDPRGGAAPIEYQGDKNGYFTIQGLQPGKHYQLIARSKDGERLLSGSTLATAPNPRLRIVMNEDYTSPTTPPLPTPKPLPERGRGQKPSGPAATIQPPRPEDENPSQPPAETNNGAKDPSKIATDNRLPPSPVINIPPKPVPLPGPSPRNTDDDPILPKVPSGADSRARDSSPGVVPVGQVPVPSCVLVGKKLDNFALFDLEGRPWEYKRNARGRLTLLHFWHSACVPCLYTVPTLVKWQKDYGASGLEVVGIAYEPGERDRQVANVRAIRGRYGINYTTLLGAGEQCPLARDFKVANHPTLVLLDENGQVVWRGEGYDPRQLQELEFEIRKRVDRR